MSNSIEIRVVHGDRTYDVVRVIPGHHRLDGYNTVGKQQLLDTLDDTVARVKAAIRVVGG